VREGVAVLGERAPKVFDAWIASANLANTWGFAESAEARDEVGCAGKKNGRLEAARFALRNPVLTIRSDIRELWLVVGKALESRTIVIVARGGVRIVGRTLFGLRGF